MTVSPLGDASPASTGRRVGAFAIDLAIAYLIGAVLVGIVAGAAFGLATAKPAAVAALLFAWSGIAVILLGWWLVYSGMQGGNGSIGQRMLGLRLVDANAGEPIGFWRAVWRNVVFGLAGSIVIGYFSPLFDRSGRRQGWHDLAAAALVVDVRGASPSSRPAFSAHTAPMPGSPSVDANPYVRPSASTPPALPSAAVPAYGGSPEAIAALGLGVDPAPTRPIEDLPWLHPAQLPAPTGAPPQPEFPSVTMPFPAATTTEPFAGGVARTALAEPPAVPFTPAALFAPTPPIAPAPVTASDVAARAGDDLDSTRVVAPPPAQRAALYAEAPVIAVLAWDDGSRMAVYGRTLYGRNPAGEQGAVAIAVRDETLSLSKTHFEIGGDTGGAWVVDRHSTNGTTLVRDGGRIPLMPGVRTPLRPGDVLELGDRRVAVEGQR